MNILFASTVFPHARDVIRGTYNRELCAALARQANVRVVAPVPWKDAVRPGRLTIPDDPSGLQIARPTYWYLPRMAPQALGSRLFAAMRRGVRQVAREWTPDLVISYWLYPDAWAAQKLASDFGCEHATIIGGSDVLQIPHEPVRGPFVRSVLKDCNAALAVSQQLVDAIVDIEPTADASVWSQGIRTEILHDGPSDLERSRLKLANDEPVYLWVGRMVPVKAMRRLFDAFAEAQAAGPSQLLLVGNGPERDGAEAYVRELGLADRVRFVGAIAPTELGTYYRAADAVVLSSDSEGLPNVLREGLACGRPFAASHVGGIGEIGDDGCRVLAPPGDSAALARAMIEVLEPRFRTAAGQWPVRTWDVAASDLLASVGGTAAVV